MSNSYVPPGQQWNPSFNFSHLQLENDFDYNNLSVQGTQRQRQQQLQHQQDQLNYTAQQYSQTPTPPHSSSSLHGAFTMPTNQQLPTQSSPQYRNGIQNDYVSNSYPNQQQQRSTTHVPASNSYLPNTFNFSSPPRAASSSMNLDPVQTSNASTFLAPQGSETQQRQSYYLPPSTSKETIPQAKRPRSDAYNDELNPEDADLDSEPSPTDQKDSANRPKL